MSDLSLVVQEMIGLTAVFTHSSRFLMNIGIFRAPGDLRILVS